MKTLGQVLKLSIDYILSKGLSQGRLEVEHLIGHVLGLKRLDLYLKYDQPLNETELDAIRKSLARLAHGEPLAYIEGTVSFYNCSIDVDRRVLIPRPETELMCEHIVKTIKAMPHETKTLWDVCTGSGCIGIAIKKAIAELTIILSDISEEALSCARHNAQKNSVSVDTVCGDLLQPFCGMHADFIVCNPPYIQERDFNQLDAHVMDFEPKAALVSGPTGYECYERLAKTMPKEVLCWLEVGSGQAELVAELFKKEGFTSIQIFTDYGGHARFLQIAMA